MEKDDLCKIIGDSATTVLLKKSSVIILDEISMMNKTELRRIDKSMQVLMQNKKPFGGKLNFSQNP